MNEYIDEQATLGLSISIGNFTEIVGKVTIQDNVNISSFVSIGRPPEHKEYDMDETLKSVVIKKNTIIREHVTINNGIEVDTQIGENCYIMNKSHIGHDAIIGNNVTISPSVNVGGHSTVSDYANLGMSSTLHQHCEVGLATMLGANAFAKGKLESGLIYVGIPAKPIGINYKGLKNSNISDDKIEELVKHYKGIYNF